MRTLSCASEAPGADAGTNGRGTGNNVRRSTRGFRA